MAGGGSLNKGGGGGGSLKGGSGLGSAIAGLGSALNNVTPPGTARWSLPANSTETIVSLQQVALPAVFLAIYRITNTGLSSGPRIGGSVVVNTDQGKFTLTPGTSIDISTQTITIRTSTKGAQGTYQLLCQAMAAK
jgi:hypothetical protein